MFLFLSFLMICAFCQQAAESFCGSFCQVKRRVAFLLRCHKSLLLTSTHERTMPLCTSSLCVIEKVRMWEHEANAENKTQHVDAERLTIHVQISRHIQILLQQLLLCQKKTPTNEKKNLLMCCFSTGFLSKTKVLLLWWVHWSFLTGFLNCWQKGAPKLKMNLSLLAHFRNCEKREMFSRMNYFAF